jgi:hypothetical protein
MRTIEEFAKSGGTVIALQNLPEAAAGMKNHRNNDKELADIVTRVFRQGDGHFIADYEIDTKPFSPARKPPEKTAPLNAAQKDLLRFMRDSIDPDFSLAGNAQSNGLTHIHKRVGDVDVYFVTNLQPDPVSTDVTFRVSAPSVQKWDGLTGIVTQVTDKKVREGKTIIPIDFEPWESAFFVFDQKGLASAGLPQPEAARIVKKLNGKWQMRLEGHGFKTLERTMTDLQSWTESPRTRHFSGTGIFETEFNLPSKEFAANKHWILDLGEMKNIAEVELNGKLVGVDWIAPYELDISKSLRNGRKFQRCQRIYSLVWEKLTLNCPRSVPIGICPGNL